MKTFEVTVNGKSARFQVRADENFRTALSRGAAKLGYRGGAWAQPNFSTNHQVTVTDTPAPGSRAWQSYNGLCSEV